MTTENTAPQEQTLDDFAKDLFQVQAAPDKEPEVEEPELESNPEDDALASEETVTEEPEETPPVTPKKKKTAQERIDEVVAARHEDNRKSAAEIATLVERIRQMEAAAKPVETPTEPQVAAPANAAPQHDAVHEDGSPVYPLGPFDPQFTADMMKWQFDTNWAERDAVENEKKAKEAETAAAEAEYNRIKTGWDAKVEEFVKTTPDFVERGTKLESTFSDLDPTYGTYLVQTLMQMDHGPEVLNYLANNVEEAKAIVASGARSATIALGRLEAQFVGKQTPAVNVSQAPTPPERLRGTGGKFEVSDDTDDIAAFSRKFYGA